MRYLYSVLRFVPDAARGEFVNIGAIVGSEDSSEWSLRLISNQKRARALDEKGLLPAVWSYAGDVGTRLDLFAEALEEGSEPAEQISEQWLTDLWETSENVVQLSQPAPIDVASLEAAFDVVFGEFIIDPEAVKYPFKKKNVAMAAVRQAFKEYDLRRGEQFFETPIVAGRHHRERFDFAVANGRAVQLTHTWSLQLPNKDKLFEDIKAWAFTVEDIRDSGGVALKSERRIEVPRDVPVVVVYVPPDKKDGATLEEARSAFKKIKAEAIPIDDARRVGGMAHDALARVG